MLTKNTITNKYESAIPAKVVQFKGVTETIIRENGSVGHFHQFVVYEDNSVEIFDFFYNYWTIRIVFVSRANSFH